MKQVMVGLIAIAVLGVPASYAQDAKLKVGTLTCQGQGGLGLIIGSKEKLRCSYQPAAGGNAIKLRGSITRLGLDIGVKGKSVMIWTVLASTTQLPGENLIGQFVGAAADASLGLGAGAQVLVGGNNKSVVLQPLGVKGATGVNLAIGVAGMTLSPQ